MYSLKKAAAYLKQQNDTETASILLSLEHAGAFVETVNGKPKIVWQHCPLPMSVETIKRDFLLPNYKAIQDALSSTLSTSEQAA